MIKEFKPEFKTNLIEYLRSENFSKNGAVYFANTYISMIRELNAIYQVEKAALHLFVTENTNKNSTTDLEKQEINAVDNIYSTLDQFKDTFTGYDALLPSLIEQTMSNNFSPYHIYKSNEEKAEQLSARILDFIACESSEVYLPIYQHLLACSPLYKLVNKSDRFNGCTSYIQSCGERIQPGQVENLINVYDKYIKEKIAEEIDPQTMDDFDKILTKYLKQTSTNVDHMDEKTKEFLTTVQSKSNVNFNISEESTKKIIDKVFQDYAGFDDIKEEILNIVASRFQDGEREKPYTVVLTGNPGTGKTTVAELMSKVLAECSVLPKKVFKKFTAGELQAKYVGQTMPKIDEIFNECRGGAIFLDEFDSLNSNDTFCKEVVKKLLSELESKNNKNTLIIIAGYEDKLNEFFNNDYGLKSRFSTKFHIPDYSIDQLLEIEGKILNKKKYMIYPNAQRLYTEDLEKQMKIENFGNARYINTSLQTIITNQNRRVWGDKTNRTISIVDVENYIKARENNIKKQNLTKLGFGN